MCRLWNLYCFRRGWSRAELTMSLSSEESRFLSWKSFFQPLTSYKSGTRRSRAPCIASSGISDRLYHHVDLPKRVSPGIKAVPRTVLNTFLGRSIPSSQQIFYEPLPILDFCLWGTYAFSALALPLPSLAATSEGPRAVLFHSGLPVDYFEKASEW